MPEPEKLVDQARHVDHVIALWPMRFRKGWSQGSCSCGEHVECDVGGVIEVWAKWHGIAVGEDAPLIDFRLDR